MTTRLIPEVGQWYAHRDKGLLFQVVAVDEAQDAVEIQDCDGDVDEMDLEAWFALSIEPAAAPEDPMGPTDEPEAGEREYTLSGDGGEREWRDPLDEVATSLDEELDEDEDLDALPGTAPARH